METSSKKNKEDSKIAYKNTLEEIRPLNLISVSAFWKIGGQIFGN